MNSISRLMFTVGAVAVLRTHCQPGDETGEDMEDEIRQDPLTSKQMRGIHAKIDADGDAKVSMSEIMKFFHDFRKVFASTNSNSVLAELDNDKDGSLSIDELMKDMERWGQEDEDDDDGQKMHAIKETEKLKFKTADSDGDGKLNDSELPALFYPETHTGVMGVVVQAVLKAKDKDGDGKLAVREFWESDSHGDETSPSDEEQEEFKRLDRNADGFIDLRELEAWESGKYHAEESMKRLFELADLDNDMHVSAGELDQAREKITGIDAQFHLMDWVEHHEL